MNYANLIQNITENIRTNGSQAITAQVLQDVLVDMVGELGQSGALLGGVIDTSFVPDPTNDAQVVYIAKGPGTYTNFNGLVVGAGEVAFFYFDGNAWAKSSVDVLEVVNNLNSTATDKALSAAMGKQIGDNISQLDQKVNGVAAQSNNLFNKDAILRDWYININTGMANPSNGWWCSPSIPVEPNSVYSITYMRSFAYYNENKEYISGSDVTIIGSFTTPANAKYIRFSGVSSYIQPERVMMNAGNVLLPYEPYIILKVDSIPTNSIAGDKIVDGSIIPGKTNFSQLVSPKNLIDETTLIRGKWMGPSGNPQSVSQSYGYFPYIPVKPQTTYYCSNANDAALSNRTDEYIAFCRSNKNVISTTPANVKTFTTPADCYFIQLSVVVSLLLSPQLEEGEARTAYEQYFEPHWELKDSVLQVASNSITSKKIADGSVSKLKLANDVIDTFGLESFKRFFVENDGIAVGGNISISNIHISKGFMVSARIGGTIESVSVGFSYLGFYGRWVEITPTQLIVRYGSSGTIDGSYNHGLTLGEETTLLIDRDLSSATLTLINDNGEVFRQVVSWSVNPGVVFVRNSNTSDSIGAELSFFPKDIREKIWMFGDSYFSYSDPARWTYYIFQWGYTKSLMDARGGENSTEAISDFENIISLGARPVFALWGLGMNDGADSATAPNSTWLSNTLRFIEVCESKGIVPILLTIPTIPSKNNNQKSAWIRNRGYRYIDMAAAVEESGTTYWKNWGAASAFLSSDETHPTAHGAKALAAQVMTDFPEIAVL